MKKRNKLMRLFYFGTVIFLRTPKLYPWPLHYNPKFRKKVWKGLIISSEQTATCFLNFFSDYHRNNEAVTLPVTLKVKTAQVPICLRRKCCIKLWEVHNLSQFIKKVRIPNSLGWKYGKWHKKHVSYMAFKHFFCIIQYICSPLVWGEHQEDRIGE